MGSSTQAQADHHVVLSISRWQSKLLRFEFNGQNSIADGIQDQLTHRMELKFAHDVAAVGLSRLGAYPE